VAYENILVERRDAVGLIRLNRPEALNALNEALIQELADALDDFESDDAIGAVVITGNEKAFAAGADIKEMQSRGYMDWFLNERIDLWQKPAACRKPVIAAVAGFALGGGCELAMMCDFIIAADSAKFGQPEITLGVLPGIGGTQRLTRLVGKSKAMDLCLTARMMARLVDEAVEAAQTIAHMSRPAAMMVKECINRSYETTLSEGVRFERRLFHSAFALEDQQEGMQAFIDKRKPQWKNR
jgi:enoyl-CoA hydratase